MANDATLPATGTVLKTREADGGHYQKYDLTKDIVTYGPTITASTSGYVEGDCVGGLLTLTDAARQTGGLVRVNSIVLKVDAAVPAGYYVVFFKAPVTAVNNAPFDLPANFPDLIATFQAGLPIPFPTGYLFIGRQNDIYYNLWSRTAALDADDLYAVVITTGNPQPLSSSELSVEIEVERF